MVLLTLLHVIRNNNKVSPTKQSNIVKLTVADFYSKETAGFSALSWCLIFALERFITQIKHNLHNCYYSLHNILMMMNIMSKPCTKTPEILILLLIVSWRRRTRFLPGNRTLKYKPENDGYILITCISFIGFNFFTRMKSFY